MPQGLTAHLSDYRTRSIPEGSSNQEQESRKYVSVRTFKGVFKRNQVFLACPTQAQRATQICSSEFLVL
jgi:hypothetical protein